MEWVKLGEIVDIKTGKLNANAAVKDGKYPFFTTAEEISRIDNYSYDDEVVLVAGNGELNVKYYNGKFDAYQRTYILTLKADQNYCMKYIYYFMSKYVEILRDQSIGGVIKYIKLENLTDAKIPRFNINAQNKIVSLLERSETLIQTRKDQIQALDDLIYSIFYNAFGDPASSSNPIKRVRLSDIGIWKSGGTPLRSNHDYYNGSIPWVTSGELNNIYIDDSIEHITEKAIEESSSKLVETGSLLLGMYDSAGLKSSITTKEMATNQAIAFSKIDSSIANALFVYTCIQILKPILLTKQRGVRQKNFNLTMIRNIQIILPPLDQQNKFAYLVEKIEGQKEILNSSLRELTDLFDSLMQDAFDGSIIK